MQILFFSDFHNAVSVADLSRALSGLDTPDIAFTLGDISAPELLQIRELLPDVPIFGVLGNHDGMDTLDKAGIPNIHTQLVWLKDLTFAGFGGSARYKHGPYPMFSQRESMMISNSLPAADILVSHDCAFHGKRTALLRKYSKDVHEGLSGISAYLKAHKPLLHVHGHIHESSRCEHAGIDTVCVYGATAVTIRDKRVEACIPLLEVK